MFPRSLGEKMIFFLNFQDLARKSRVDKILYQHQRCWIDSSCLVLLVAIRLVIMVASIVCYCGSFWWLQLFVMVVLGLLLWVVLVALQAYL